VGKLFQTEGFFIALPQTPKGALRAASCVFKSPLGDLGVDSNYLNSALFYVSHRLFETLHLHY
jgi:hypothetical protein